MINNMELKVAVYETVFYFNPKFNKISITVYRKYVQINKT